MSLIDQEIKKRGFRGKLSRGFENAKAIAKKEMVKAKDDFQEKREFKGKLKAVEKQSYRKNLMIEAGRSGKRRAKTRYSKKRKSVIGSVLSKPKGNPDFFELPKMKGGKKEKDVFDW